MMKILVKQLMRGLIVLRSKQWADPTARIFSRIMEWVQGVLCPFSGWIGLVVFLFLKNNSNDNNGAQVGVAYCLV